MTSPLFTHVITGRNDNYLGNFRHRLEMMLNYNCGNAVAAGNGDDYEVLVVDWNSDSPLREALNLNDAARSCVSFLEVTPEIVKQNAPRDVKLDIGPAGNVGIRRARGEIVIYTAADVLFPPQPFKNLFALYRGEIPCPVDVRRCYMGVTRRLIPWQAAERLRLEDLERYFLLHSAYLEFNGAIHPIASGEGAHIVSRSFHFEAGGLNEDMPYWGGHDDLLGYRAALKMPLLKSTFAGVFCYDLTQSPQIRRSQIRKNAFPKKIVFRPNGADWGLGDIDIPRRPALHCPDVDNFRDPRLPARDADTPGDGKRADNEKSPGSAFFGRCCRIMAKTAFRIGSASSQGLPRTLAGAAGYRWFLRSLVQEGKDSNVASGRGELFADAADACSFHKEAMKKFLALNPRAVLTLEAAETYLALSEIIRKFRPGRFLFANARHLELATLPIALDPTIDISFNDNGAGGALYLIHRIRFFSEYRGYLYRNIGPANTFLANLADMPLIGDPYDCLFLDLAHLNMPPEQIHGQIGPLLAASCAMILKGEGRDGFAELLRAGGFIIAGRLNGTLVLRRNAKSG